MAKKLDANGVEHTPDGEPVTLYDAKMVGTFVMENWDAAPISSGDQVTFIIHARCEDPIYKHIKKTGELKRTNPFRIEDFTCVDSDVAGVLYDAIARAAESGTTLNEQENGSPSPSLVQPSLISDDDVVIYDEEELELI
jgi:hypothetical protein